MIVLKFGVRSIVSGEKAAHEEMWTAHRLYNALISVERWRRREYAALRSRYVPGLSEIEEAYEQISEWIGEHAGGVGERGTIREKRRSASAPRTRGGKATPTKRVDVPKELDAIAELKAWRTAASATAKPLRAAFDTQLREPRLAYEARTRGVPLEWLETREELRVADKPDAVEKIVKKIESASRKTHVKAVANARVLEEMLGEDWAEAWKNCARLDDTAHRLKQWIGDAHHLNHGTYVAVSEDVERAGKRPRPRPDGEPRKPRERPAFSRGRLRKMGWQLQGAVTWGDILAGHHRDVVVDANGNRARCRIRITTVERGVNEWVDLDIAYHRAIPDDTRIRWVYLVPDPRPHRRYEYSVQFTAEPTRPLITRAAGDGCANIALCWTQDGDTLTVARIDGHPLRLPASVPARLRHADEIRGAGDLHFDEARRQIVARLDGIPESAREACVGIHQWRAHEKMHRVCELLREPIPNDERLRLWDEWRSARGAARLDLFASLAEYATWVSGRCEDGYVFALWLETWRRKDKHLVQMEDGLRRGAIGCRRDFYRVTAARLSERHETYELSGAVDLEALALRDKAEDRPAELHQAARRNRTIAAVSEFKEALAHAFGRERSGAEKDPGGARTSTEDAVFRSSRGTDEVA